MVDSGGDDAGGSAAPDACRTEVDGGHGATRTGDTAPGFTLRALDGTCRRLADYRGRPVVLTFFASWCHPCEQEMPLLEDAAGEHGDDLQVLAVSFRDLRMDSEDFVERLEVTYPAFHDAENAVAEAYGVRAIPQTFFIDEAGVVRDRVFGITSKRALDAPLDALLGP